MTYTIPSYTVQPGSVYQPKTLGPAYVLDQIGGVIGCWSTRQLMAAGSGNIIRGRDATTNEADYTSAAYPAGIVTLANGGDAFCPALYDQSGNGNNSTQITAASQPKLVDTGSLIVDGSSRPVMYFDGSSDFFYISPTITIASDFSLLTYVKFDSLTNQVITSDGANDAITLNKANQLLIRLTSFQTLNLNSSLVSGNWYSLFCTRASGIIKIYINSVEQSSTISNSNSYIVNRLGNQFSNYLNGSLGFAVILNKSINQSEVTQLHNALAL